MGVRPYVVERGQRRSLVVTEDGEISSAEISAGTKGPYHIQFITLEPDSLLLPVLLHADMVFYVHTGNGKLSNLDPEREKMRIHAIFSNTDEGIYDPSIGAYSSINDLVLGFDRKILNAAFKVPEEVLEEIANATKPPPVVHAVTEGQKSALWKLEDQLVNFLVGGKDDSLYDIGNKHKKTKETKTFNILDADPDFENCNGWSLTVDKWSLKSLRDSNIGIFMVHLTKGSMMGPHWNPMATEIAVVLHGQGMIRVVCPGTATESECKNMRFKVKEGDVFAVSRFHPMAQISFNNDSFVFMGFSSSTKRNHPQFLTGKSSILRMVDRSILAVSFSVTNTTMDQLLNAQEEALILDCTSCAEEEDEKMKGEIEKEKQEEEATMREEERKREIEEEEEEEREREEEEARKREEEKRRKEEEEKREQEEAERERELTRGRGEEKTEDQDRKGDEGKRRRALRKVWKL
ncbi:hypothetical protein OIU84_006006 [Salix udensis]|uniref:Cupin type-1 domain-containing protein n=1 Tax=Salix udensis TaxID=889485 RepID=A0AAD6JZ28_9ROSI|nr:hypothetical protein OIU84_006006 [Salix udensis]